MDRCKRHPTTGLDIARRAQDEDGLRDIRAELAADRLEEAPALAAYYLAWIDYRLATLTAGAGASGRSDVSERIEEILAAEVGSSR